MNQPRDIGRAAAAGLMLVMAVGFLFMFVGGVGSMLFESGQRLLDPESYWTKEVSRNEARFKALSAELSSCRQRVLGSDREAAALYGSFIQQGWPTNKAFELAVAHRQGVQTSCNQHIDAMIVETKKLADAKAKLQQSR